MAVIVVGMADIKVARSPDTLTTLGLGSCVGVTLVDPGRKIGGLAHIMLPTSTNFGGHNRAKFADTAIVDMIDMLIKIGASRSALVAKLAGGAHMFGGSTSDILKVGERNAIACVEILNQLRIPIKANDTGGKYGRTIELDIATGRLRVKTVGYGETYI